MVNIEPKEEEKIKESSKKVTEEISAEDALAYRRLLKDDTEFRGWVKTAELILKK